MQFYLYRPTTWRRGGSCICLTNGDAISAREQALLVQLKRATFLLPPDFNQGESMNDDRSSVLRLITPPSSEPITLTQAKLFLRIEHRADDEVIARAIAAARYAAEQYMRLALLPQTWEYGVANPCAAVLYLPFGPAQAVESVTVTDAAGASTALDASNYSLSIDGFCLYFSNPLSVRKLVVRYMAATAMQAADVSPLIVQGILQHVAVMVENREGAAPMPMQSVSCYQPYRRVAL